MPRCGVVTKSQLSLTACVCVCVCVWGGGGGCVGAESRCLSSVNFVLTHRHILLFSPNLLVVLSHMLVSATAGLTAHFYADVETTYGAFGCIFPYIRMSVQCYLNL